MTKGVRKNLSVPGLLASPLRERAREFGHRTISPFAVDLVCYDLRMGASHIITLPISQDTQAAQDAVDAELAARYRPYQPRRGLLVEFVERLDEIRSIARFAEAPAAMKSQPERLTFPAAIWPLIDLRWRELGYTSLSAYLTGLIRYDLLVGGPHLFTASDMRGEVQAALNRETRDSAARATPRKLFLDYLIERAMGRTLTPAELDRIKREIARHLLRYARTPKPVHSETRMGMPRQARRTLSSTLSRQRAD